MISQEYMNMCIYMYLHNNAYYLLLLSQTDQHEKNSLKIMAMAQPWIRKMWSLYYLNWDI